MANPTAGTTARFVGFQAGEQMKVKLAGGTPASGYSTASAANWTVYPGEMIGVNVSGYHQKFDDTAPLRFAGIVSQSGRVYVDSGDADGDNEVVLTMPRSFTMLTSGAAITDLGRRVYAKFSNEVQRVPGTYGNHIGRVVRYNSATEVEIEPDRYTRPSLGYRGRVILAATGTITLAVSDIGKVIVCTSTAAQTINLPPIAGFDVGEGFLFFKGSGGTFTVTLDGDGSETINGATTSATMTANYKYVEIVKMEVASGTYEWSILRSN